MITEYDKKLLNYIKKHDPVTFSELCKTKRYNNAAALSRQLENLSNNNLISIYFKGGRYSDNVPTDDPITLTDDGEYCLKNFRYAYIKKNLLETRNWAAFILSVIAFLWQVAENFF